MTEAVSAGAAPAAPVVAEGALGIGEALARAREAQGLALPEISQQLKFMPRQLEALEAERFDLLPGPTIARGMVRNYARFLKLDPEPLIARMAGTVEPKDATPQLAARFSQPVPFADSGRRSTIVYLALSLVVLGIGGGVLYEWRREALEPRFIAAAKLPEPAAAPAAERRAPNPQTASAAPVPLPPVAPRPASDPARTAAAPKAVLPPAGNDDPERVAGTKSIGSAKTIVEASAVDDDEAKAAGSQRMVFRFDQEAWIEVTDGAGRLLASSLNPAGSERVLQGRAPFELVIGNASHVRLTYNDREVDLQPHIRVEVARFKLP